MKRNEIEKLYNSISNIDGQYIEDARTKKIKTTPVWKKWGAMAACLCLIVAGAVVLPRFIGNNPPSTLSPSQEGEGVYEFTMEESDVHYCPISFSQRKTFGLVDVNATGLTNENTYQITADDLGDVMGVVGDSQDESIIGETVYHFIKFPADDSICIVEVRGTYEFFVKDGVEGIEGTNSSNTIIDAPVDEDTYHEVGPNTPAEDETEHDDIETSNGTITLEYITKLQAKVSTAMRNGKLPFVSSSAVYENPYRLHVTVSSNAEDDLAKLKVFDTIGGAMEIVYETNSISVEDAITE